MAGPAGAAGARAPLLTTAQLGDRECTARAAGDVWVVGCDEESVRSVLDAAARLGTTAALVLTLSAPSVSGPTVSDPTLSGPSLNGADTNGDGAGAVDALGGAGGAGGAASRYIVLLAGGGVRGLTGAGARAGDAGKLSLRRQFASGAPANGGFATSGGALHVPSMPSRAAVASVWLSAGAELVPPFSPSVRRYTVTVTEGTREVTANALPGWSSVRLNGRIVGEGAGVPIFTERISMEALYAVPAVADGATRTADASPAVPQQPPSHRTRNRRSAAAGHFGGGRAFRRLQGDAGTIARGEGEPAGAGAGARTDETAAGIVSHGVGDVPEAVGSSDTGGVGYDSRARAANSARPAPAHASTRGDSVGDVTGVAGIGARAQRQRAPRRQAERHSPPPPSPLSLIHI